MGIEQPLLLDLPAEWAGERVILRRWRDEHAEALFTAIMASKEHIAQWLPWAAHYQAVDDARVFIRRHSGHWALHKHIGLGIFHRADQALLGSAEPATDGRSRESKPNKGGAGGTAPVYDEARRQLLIFVQDLARELNDSASLRSSTSRLANLHHKSGLALEDFIAHLYAARAITQERTAAIRTPAAKAAGTWQKNKMGDCCAVLEDQLGRRAREAGGCATYPWRPPGVAAAGWVCVSA